MNKCNRYKITCVYYVSTVNIVKPNKVLYVINATPQCS